MRFFLPLLALLMALPATETFTGGAGALGAGFTQQHASTVNRDGAGLGTASTGGDSFAFDNVNTYSDNQYSQQTTVSTSGGSPEPIVRASGSGATTKCYFANFGAGSWGIGKYDNDVYSSIASVAGTSAAGDVVRLEVRGGALKLLVNSVVILTGTDATPLPSGAAGPGLDNGTAILIDNWEGGSLAGATAALTGTATASITEADIVAGGKTIIVTLTSDTWIPA